MRRDSEKTLGPVMAGEEEIIKEMGKDWPMK